MLDSNPTDPVLRRNKRRMAVLLLACSGLLLAGAGSAAFAVSGGGYTPSQQGCQPTDSDYDTPVGQTYSGCHTGQLTVESGQTKGGAPTSSNTKYVSVGIDQLPNDPKSPNAGFEENLGLPGGSTSPHGFCFQANTDGTNSQPASKPESSKKAIADGCKGNSAGTGFAENVDYYNFYCPIAAALQNPCEATGYGGAPGSGISSLAPAVDTGKKSNLQPIVQNGVIVYYGMDDNTDSGEHDGVGPYCGSAPAQPKHGSTPAPDCPKANGAANGSSDGGAIMLALTPLGVTNTPSQTHPEGLANFSLGFCADGICTETTTQQQTVYHGCGANPTVTPKGGCKAPKNANVYDYAPGGNPNNDPSVNRESANCNSGDPSTTSLKACGSGGMNYWRSVTPANENAEPGVQVYTDPDPQRSPATNGTPLWPTPGIYVGTCGVYAGSPAITGQIPGFNGQTVGGQQVTNNAGQVAIDPNPSVC